MNVNILHHDDVRRTVSVTSSILNLIGAWPLSDNSSTLRIIQTNMIRILSQALLYFIIVPGILMMFLKESNAQRCIKMIGPICSCLMAVLKHILLIYRSNRLKDCIEHIEKDWSKASLIGDRKIMISNSKIGRSLAIICITFVYGSGFSFRTIVPLFRGVIVTPTKNVTIRPMGFDGYYIFVDPQKTPAYEIIFSLQFLFGFVHDSATSGAYSLAILLVLHACGQLKILITRMKDLTQAKSFSDKYANEKLAVVVKQHIRIKR